MNITAKVIQASLNYETGTTIWTYELEYPRYIHAEFMTHRMFSRNSASSRAIPVASMHEQIRAANVEFVHYGLNQPGMQSAQELNNDTKNTIRNLWFSARDFCLAISEEMNRHKAHKQLVNRVTEPWMMMKVVMTTTNDANWEWLRNHPDAQPEIHELASVMLAAKNTAEVLPIHCGEWHVPYVHRYFDDSDTLCYQSGDTQLTPEQARKVSASCCAQVSYRKNDYSVEKAEQIYDRLIHSEPVHASPIEHQATPITQDMYQNWRGTPGITHEDWEGTLWSGNFHNWIQYRQLVPNNTRKEIN
jgi:hypothetical protein